MRLISFAPENKCDKYEDRVARDTVAIREFFSLVRVRFYQLGGRTILNIFFVSVQCADIVSQGLFFFRIVFDTYIFPTQNNCSKKWKTQKKKEE